MEKTRLYEIIVEESCGAFGGSCPIAIVKIKSESAEKAIEEALRKVESKIESGPLLVRNVGCLGCLEL